MGTAAAVAWLRVPRLVRAEQSGHLYELTSRPANYESTRDTWAMVLGAGVDKPTIVERPIRHVDFCPSLAGVLGCRPMESQGASLPELRG